MNRTFEKHLAAIKAGRIDRSNVIGIKKATNAFERASAGYSNGRTSPNWTAREMQELSTAIRLVEPRVCGALHTSGMKVLRDRRYAKRWSPFERSVIDRLNHFRLAGFMPVGRWNVVPIYRAVADFGGGFYFFHVPWQAAAYGGEVEAGPHVLQEKPQ